jgi:pyruvate dehydrogenase E1 component beta subunit
MEALFSQIPGLRVVAASSPARAYGLLLAAIRDPDPVIFMEPKRIYRMVKEEVPDNGEALPLDVCFTLREGSDITLVTWGAMVHETLLVANKLENQGIQSEVIDVATIKPLDIDTILQSVEKTGRCVIIQEANPTCSVSSEIAAQLAEKGLTSLMAPVKRVTGYDTVMPLYRSEKLYLPSEQRILSAVNAVLEYA